MLRNLILAGVLALGAGMSHAATCDVGSCSVIGNDGQFLSDRVQFDVNDIIGDGVSNDGESGAFTFSGNFINDTNYDGAAVAGFLVSTTQGSITDLMLNILNPGIAASYSLLHDTFVTISLAAAGAPPQVIDFTLTGTATRGTQGGDPDINLSINPVPVPAGFLLMGTALAGFGVAARRRRKAS